MKSTRNINNELTGKIIDIVCDAWGVTRAELASSSRKQPLPWARSQLCQYLCLYAGHDTVSCAAIIKRNERTTLDYRYRYQKLLRKFTPFAVRDQNIKSIVREINKKCKQKK